MDLHDQHVYMEKTGQWRFTPPTHVVAALAEAVRQFVEEGGQPARLARYTANCAALVDGMKALGFVPFLRAGDAGADHRHLPCAGRCRRYEFKAFYEAVKARGFILYPGKLTQVETFRVGCIGAIGPAEMKRGGRGRRRRDEGARHRQRRAAAPLRRPLAHRLRMRP